MILLIDNYDSFTYNLYQFIGEFNDDIMVVRNDKITPYEVMEMNPEKIVISPGPKTPKDAGNCLEIIRFVSGKIPVLGICLGHQCIGEAFGGKVIHAKKLYHGKSSVITLAKHPLFENTGETLQVARYHSLVVEKPSLPECFEILGETEDEEIMAMVHKDYPIYGLQFHPESVLTPEGKNIVKNFVNL
jgi:anthranilate synthase component 2